MPTLIGTYTNTTPGAYSASAPPQTTYCNIVACGGYGGGWLNNATPPVVNTGGGGREVQWLGLAITEGDTVSGIIGEAGYDSTRSAGPGAGGTGGAGGSGATSGRAGGNGGSWTPPDSATNSGGGGGGGSTSVVITGVLDAELGGGGGRGEGSAAINADDPGGPATGVASPHAGLSGEPGIDGDGGNRVTGSGFAGSSGVGGDGQNGTNPPLGTPTGGNGGGGGGGGDVIGGGGGGGCAGLFDRAGGSGCGGTSVWDVTPDNLDTSFLGQGGIIIEWYADTFESGGGFIAGSAEWS